MSDGLYSEAIAQFREWFEEALNSEIVEPTAMILATRGIEAGVSARTVLLKKVSEAGFVFYTNTRSRKGRQLEADARCSLCFLWAPLKHQVQVEGRAILVPDSEADAYWETRPRGSQIGAWASRQSEPLESREELERRFSAFEDEYAERTVPRPPHWTGYRVIPDMIEFWSGRDARLHDRWRYTRGDDGWKKERLNP